MLKKIVIGGEELDILNRNEVEQKINSEETARISGDTAINDKIGDTTNLATNDKSTIVNSVNELNSKRIEHLTREEYDQKLQDDTLEAGVTYLIENTQSTSYTDLLNIIYPVGSIYLSMDDNFLPSTAFGGTWEKIQTGRYLQATDTGAGTQVAESLPNIKGTQQTGSSKALIAHPSISVNSTSLIGTLSVGDNGKILYGTNGGVSAWAFLDFDASRVCSTYQNGAKVQPDSIKVVMWKRIS